MARRGLLFLGLLALALIVQAPATLLDTAVQSISRDNLRLLAAEGSLWHGQGRLASRDPVTNSALPWLALSWDFAPLALFAGEFSWSLRSGGQLIGVAALGPGGLKLRQVQLQAPATVLAAIPSALTRAGWGGSLHLAIDELQCSFDQLCQGDLALRWYGVSSSLFPGRSFGDYEVRGLAQGRNISLNVQTLRGETQLAGSGSVVGRDFAFKGSIQGPEDFVRRLPGIAGGSVCPEETSGRLSINLPASRAECPLRPAWVKAAG